MVKTATGLLMVLCCLGVAIIELISLHNGSAMAILAVAWLIIQEVFKDG
jgi:hypothetical protein